MENFSDFFMQLTTLQGWVNLLTLTVLETVLGIDNIIFVSIIAGRLPNERQKSAWNIGLMAAMFIRIVLLFFLSFIMTMKDPLFEVFDHGFSGKDLILFAGGVFLLVKTTSEIHNKVEGEAEEEGNGKKAVVAFGQILFQIILIDIVFSFDSILTAVGISGDLAIMIVAVIVSTIIMMLFSRVVAAFIERHPTVKMLALAFLLMIGMVLIMEAFHFEVPKPYVYCSMGFAFLVELLNMRVRKNSGGERKG